MLLEVKGVVTESLFDRGILNDDLFRGHRRMTRDEDWVYQGFFDINYVIDIILYLQVFGVDIFGIISK